MKSGIMKNNRLMKTVAFLLFLLGGSLVSSFSPLSAFSAENGETSTVKESPSSKKDETQDQKVLDRYWKLLLDSPKYGTVFDRIYYHYADEGRVEELLKRIDALPPTEDPVVMGNRFLLRGLILIRQNDLSRAVESFQEGEQVAPENPQLSLLLGKTLLLRGYLQEGADALERAIQKGLPTKERIAALQELGETYLRLDRPEKADAIWNELTENYSDQSDVLSRVAEIFESAGEYRKALSLYQRLEGLAKEERNAEDVIQFAISGAEMKIRLGEKKEAIFDMERLLEGVTSDNWLFAPLRDRIEALFLQQSDYNALLDYYQSWSENHPNDLDAIRRRARILSQLSRFEEAKKLLNAALERAPSDIPLRRALLEIALTENRYDEADRLYGELDALEPNNPDNLIDWGKVILKNDRLDESTKKERAVQTWRRILPPNRKDRATSLLLAETLASNHFRTEAETIYRELIDENPDDPANYELFARFYLDGHDPERALAVLDRMTEGKRALEANFIRKIDFLQKNGLTQEAVAPAEEAIQKWPERFDFHRRLIEVVLDGGPLSRLENEWDVAEKLARNEEEKNLLLSLRLRYLKGTDGLVPFLNSLKTDAGGESPSTADDSKVAEIVKPSASDERDLSDLYWKKVVTLLFMEDTARATETMIDALRQDAVSPLLLQRGGEVAAKSPIPERTLDLLNLLREKDPQNKGRYLRSLSKIQMEMGDQDGSVRTARELMESGTGNGSDLLFYADTLISVGDRDEAISVLRKGLSLDSAEPVALTRLATLLDESGKTNEAIDLQWERFNRSTRLEEKLQIVDSLVRFYQKIDRFDLFKERLLSSVKDEKSRRERSYCLARAYMSIKDFQSARSTLESLLTFVRDQNQEDEFLLSHLSGLAELQNDLENAIRYQESLCSITDDMSEKERLLSLYRKAGKKDQAKRFLLTKILPKESLAKQLETVDTLMAAEDLSMASEILTALSEEYPDQWEIVARQMTIAGWNRANEELATLIERIDRDPLPAETKSVQEQEREREGKPVGRIASGGDWSLGNLRDAEVKTLEDPESLRNEATQIILTLFRDRLTSKEKRSAYSVSGKAPKPIPAFPNLLAARLLAEVWKMCADNLTDPPASATADLLKRRTEEMIARLDSDPEDLTDSELKTIYVFNHLLLLLKENDLITDDVTREARASVAGRVEGIFVARGRREWLPNDREEGYSSHLAEIQMERLPWNLFVKRVRQAGQEAITQARASRKIDQVYQLFGEMFVHRLNEEFRTTLEAWDLFDETRASRQEEIWRQLSEKTSFGPTVLQSFIRMSHSVLFPVDLDLSKTDGVNREGETFEESIVRYRERVQDLLAFALEMDRVFREGFPRQQTGIGNGAGAIPFEEVARSIGRNPKNYLSLASFLINKSIYSDEEGRSLIEVGKILETAYGNAWALDFIREELPSKEGNDLMDTATLERFVTEEGEKAPDGLPEKYRRKMGEVLQGVVNHYRGINVPETVDSLKEKAVWGLQGNKPNSPKNVPLYGALAMLALFEGNEREAMGILEKIDCSRFADHKTREMMILNAFADSSDPTIIARKQEAIQTLLGVRLTEDEMMAFDEILLRENHQEEADRLQIRLYRTAIQEKNIATLLEKILTLHDRDQDFNEEEIVFALKSFRIPLRDVNLLEPWNALRAASLTILVRSGKLEEIRGELERQLASAPGSLDLLLRLATIEIKEGNQERAEELFQMIESRLPEDSPLLLQYANLLADANQDSRAFDYLKKVFDRQPALFFSERQKFAFWNERYDLDYLQSLDPERIVPVATKVFALLLDEKRNEDFREESISFLESLWNGEGLTPDSQEALRTSVVRLLAESGETRFFPLLHDWFLGKIRPLDENSPGLVDQQDYDIHRLIQWNPDSPRTLSVSFLTMAEKAGELDSLLTEVHAINEAYVANPPTLFVRFGAAAILEIQILNLLGKEEDAVTRLQELGRFDSFCSDGAKNDPLALLTSFGKNGVRYADLLLPYAEKGYEENPHPAYEPFYLTRINLFRLHSESPELREKGLHFIRKKLNEIFSLLATTDGKKNLRIANSTYNVETISFYQTTFGNALIDRGEGELLRDVMVDSGLTKRFEEKPEEMSEMTPEMKALFEESKLLYEKTDSH